MIETHTDGSFELRPRQPAERFLTCSFCDQPSRFVLTCLGRHGRTGRMIRLAEATCGRTECPGPGKTGPSYRAWQDVPLPFQRSAKPERWRGYSDIMLSFIACDRNNDPETYADGGRWTWHTPEVWVRWLAATRVRGILRHAADNQ